ncbi:MAG TPA: hypothetical protein DCM05_13415 [Elusimicrobia bacterium]|nr:hypothetical protein [Elusimicrobiota bacterium]
MTLKDLRRLAAQGEGPRLEFKRSTGELQEALQTACAFMNGLGGRILVGVKPDGTLAGQQVSDKTLRDIAHALEGFEPPSRVDVERVPLASGLEILVITVPAAGGAVSLAIFDDRVEIWSAGALPSGITPEALSRKHLSVQRNPLIADVFYRAGLIEKWGRGTNRVIEQCRKHGIAPPTFEEITGATVVTFRAQVRLAVPPHETPHVTPHETPHVGAQAAKLLAACREPCARDELQRLLGLHDRMHFLRTYIEPLMAKGWLEMTIPDKPKSRLQRYRATAAGLAQLQGSRKS